MKSLISQFFQADVPLYVEALRRLEANVAADAAPDDHELLQSFTNATITCLEACAELETQIETDEELLRATQERFRDAIQPWFDQSWFMERAKNKPRGYPGDYETLIGIYDNRPRSTGLGGYLDRYFLNATLAHAVRDRLDDARQFLITEVQQQDRQLHLINVACGPCREYTHSWDNSGKPVRVTCIDMDQQALSYVERAVGSLTPTGLDLTTRVYNALRMSSAEKNVKEFGRADVIYSIGLCDYISDNYMVRILRGWRESLASGGVVYVAFKDCLQYGKTKYAWLTDWHFIPRTEEHCRQLFLQAGYDADEIQMSRSNASPTIMNFVCRLPDIGTADHSTKRTRVDTHLVIS